MGRIEVGLANGEVVSKTYDGRDNLLIFKKVKWYRREEVRKQSIKNMLELVIYAAMGMTTALVFGDNAISLLIGIPIFILMMARFGIGMSKIEDFHSAHKVKYKSESEITDVYEFDGEHNNLVMLEDGNICRIYQLIDDNIVEGLSISNEELLTSEIPVSIGDKEIKKEISHDIAPSELSVEGKVVYDIGNSIPKISVEDMKSILDSIESIYRYKVSKDREELYNSEYKKAIEINKGNIKKQNPILTNSEEYIKEELKSLRRQLNKELEENKVLVKELR